MARKGTAKLAELRNIEKSMQKKWEDEKLFEVDAPEDGKGEKFFTTFPYPYMNGRLHLGHSFTLSKCDFAVGYNRLKGRRSLWPFGFHCTGMPIRASADRLIREMKIYGNPPKFPQEEEEEEKKKEEKAVQENKGKGKKNKLAAKSSGLQFQWQIMQSLEIKDEEISKFASTTHWLQYFPPLSIKDLKLMGVKVDWRRSFITTEANPYYDSFVRWHMRKLKAAGRVKFGKRYTIFSEKDGQPCMDHDRASGEGIGPQEYTLVKMKLCHPLPTALRSKLDADSDVFLVAATLRPETMYGQTNCWLHPEITYSVVKSKDHGYFVCTLRSARNMSRQGILPEDGKVDVLLEVKGKELLGSALEAPHTVYPRIYTLPMMTIKDTKSTGVVTSVPSDSPDDYAALRDLKRKPAMREKFGITEEMVAMDPVPIIAIPELGNLAAPLVVEEMKIASQNDADLLTQAKNKVYRLGFYDGVMLMGSHAGWKVQDAKKGVQAELIRNRDAVLYYEPEQTVISRSGDECVVALCDQWYLDYGNDEWKEESRQALKQLETFSDEVRNNFEATISWLKEHALSRQYGLGTRLPWDQQYLIESLSDSTVYMAYYTVSHLLHGGSLDGSKPGWANVSTDAVTDEVWDAIFYGTPVSSSCKISKSALERMRHEFTYWYPMNMRASGKDLVPNHLTYMLFNHSAVWPNQPGMWPRSVHANGHLVLNGEKMAKSTGNFLTLIGAIEKYSADGMRLALADAGDSVEDGNFDESMADAGLLRLHTFLDWVREILPELDDEKRTDVRHCDRVFEAGMNKIIMDCEKAYEQMMYKEALKIGLYEFQGVRDRYREVSLGQPRSDLIRRYIKTQLLLLSPICTHLCDYIWRELLHNADSIMNACWPTVEWSVTKPEDSELILHEGQFLSDATYDFRLRLRAHVQPKKGKGKVPIPTPTNAIVKVARRYPTWQAIILNTLRDLYSESEGFPDNKEIMNALKTHKELSKYMKKAMPFAQMLKERVGKLGAAKVLTSELEVDEEAVMNQNARYLASTLGLEGKVEVQAIENVDVEEIYPQQPHILFFKEPKVSARFINPNPMSGHFAIQMPVINGDNGQDLADRLAMLVGVDTSRVTVWRFADPIVGPRTLPGPNTPPRIAISCAEKIEVNETAKTSSDLKMNGIGELGEFLLYTVN